MEGRIVPVLEVHSVARDGVDREQERYSQILKGKIETCIKRSEE